uniref:ISXO2-like transposase domain-containing protein n=1 Tax=Trichuris muris TaxID=70415 RepID=A0A5S6Q8S1_TRIMR
MMANASTFREICSRFKDEDAAVAFFKGKGVLHRQRSCVCGHPMKIAGKKNGQARRCRCYKAQCNKEVSLRTGTWFEGHRSDFRTAVLFIYAWSREYTTTGFCSQELGMSSNCAVGWKKSMREVAPESLLRNPLVIGGTGLTVEVDETVFSKRKYQRGRTYPEHAIQRFGYFARRLKQLDCLPVSRTRSL